MNRLNILIVEDLPSDAELALRQLHTVFSDFDHQVVDTRQDFVAALNTFMPDLIISDYQMPEFNGMTALSIVREEAPFLPFIVLTGSMNEDTAVECMKAGADDYVIKEHIKRLGEAAKNAIHKKETEHEHFLALRALEESEERFRGIFENVTIGIYRSDIKGQILLANNALISMLGFASFDDLISSNLNRDIVKNADVGREAFIEQLRREGVITGWESEWTTQTGSSLDVCESARVYYDGKGQVLYFEGTVEDISQRKTAERQRELHARVLAILNRPNEWDHLLNDLLSVIKEHTSFDAVGIRLEKDGDYPYYVQNGFSENHLTQENSLVCKTSDLKMRQESSDKPLDCLCGRVIEGKVPENNPFFTDSGSFWINDLSLISDTSTADGIRYDIRSCCIKEGYRTLAILPLKSGNEIIGVLQMNDRRSRQLTSNKMKFFEEIAHSIGIAFQRMQSEIRIRTSEKKYRSLIENSNDAIYLLRNDRFEIVNREFERMFEILRDEIIHPDFDMMNLIAPKSRSLIEERRRKVESESGQNTRYEFTGVTKSGHELEIDANLAYIKLDDGLVIQGILRDITDRKRAEEQVRKELDEKRVLLQEVHHRVKNNLTLISSLLNLQSRKINSRKEALDAFAKSRDRVLAMSMVHERFYGLQEYTHIDMKDFVISLFNKLLHVYFSKTKIQVDYEIDDILIDINRAVPCGLIFNELITNALKHAFKRRDMGAIQISFTILDNREYQIIVKDDGKGLPESSLTGKPETLGIQLVSILTEQLDGRYEVHNNQGAEFRIRFPMNEHTNQENVEG